METSYLNHLNLDELHLFGIVNRRHFEEQHREKREQAVEKVKEVRLSSSGPEYKGQQVDDFA